MLISVAKRCHREKCVLLKLLAVICEGSLPLLDDNFSCWKWYLALAGIERCELVVYLLEEQSLFFQLALAFAICSFLLGCFTES